MASNSPFPQVVQQHFLGTRMIGVIPQVGVLTWIIGQVEKLSEWLVHKVNELPVLAPNHGHEFGVGEYQVLGLLGI